MAGFVRVTVPLSLSYIRIRCLRHYCTYIHTRPTAGGSDWQRLSGPVTTTISES